MRGNPPHCQRPGFAKTPAQQAALRCFMLGGDYSIQLDHWKGTRVPLLRLWRKRRARRTLREMLRLLDRSTDGRLREMLLEDRTALRKRRKELFREIVSAKARLRKPASSAPSPIAGLPLKEYIRVFFRRHGELTPDAVAAADDGFSELSLALSRLVSDRTPLAPGSIARAGRHIVHANRVQNALTPLLKRLSAAGLSPARRREREGELRAHLTQLLGGFS